MATDALQIHRVALNLFWVGLGKRNKLESSEGADDYDDAPAPVMKRRRIMPSLGLGERNKRTTSEGAAVLDQRKTLLMPP